jgi:NCS1 family nucleobase:cation symporter-1
MELLGYAIGRLSLGGDVTHGISVLSPTPMADVVFVTVILICIAGCVMNAYSGVMSAISWGLPLERRVASVAFCVVGTVLALVFSGPRFEPALEKFLYLVVYFVTPWLSLVLVNWLLRSRKYGGFPSLNVFYDPHGELGGVKWAGIAALLIGVGVSVPFMATSLYTGPLGHALDGADISYVVSAVVAAAIYYPLSRTEISTRTASPADSTVAAQATGR